MVHICLVKKLVGIAVLMIASHGETIKLLLGFGVLILCKMPYSIGDDFG
jgi:hypothetical protein